MTKNKLHIFSATVANRIFWKFMLVSGFKLSAKIRYFIDSAKFYCNESVVIWSKCHLVIFVFETLSFAHNIIKIYFYYIVAETGVSDFDFDK